MLIRRLSVRAAFSGKKRDARKGRLGGDHGLAEGLEDVGCVLAADVSCGVVSKGGFFYYGGKKGGEGKKGVLPGLP